MKTFNVRPGNSEKEKRKEKAFVGMLNRRKEEEKKTIDPFHESLGTKKRGRGEIPNITPFRQKKKKKKKKTTPVGCL